MIIITDANIIISGILNPYGIIASLLIQDHPGVDFAAPEFAITEIRLHQKRICSRFKIKPAEFEILLDRFLTNITLFSNEAVNKKIYNEAEKLTSVVDSDDTWHVAFAIALDALLWTADLKLHYALRKQDFYKTIITQEFASILRGL
jgi:predicted nucleic acid-binding protein